MSVTTKLHALQDYMDDNFPGCLIMPCRSDKTPKYCHKGGKWTSASARAAIQECNEVGALLLLTKDLIVIDVDEEEWVEKVEKEFPMLLDTVSCRTKKGKHYYVKWTPECSEVDLFDSIRKMKTADSEGNIVTAPIDIKTVARTGTKSAIAIPPSPNKVWTVGKELGFHEPIPMPEDFLAYYTCSVSLNHNGDQSTNDDNEKLLSSTNDDEIDALINILSPSRADNYDDWLRLGFCLHNINPSDVYLERWKCFSQKCVQKYDENECEKIWHNMSNTGLGIGSLHMWAKQDNAYEYNIVLSRRFQRDIEYCNGTHFGMANLVKNMLKGQHVCVSIPDKLWYRFNGTLWKVDKGGNYARMALSEYVLNQFTLTLNRLKSQQSKDDDMQSDASKTSSIDVLKQKCKHIDNIILKLQNRNYKDLVLAEMNTKMVNEGFVDLLDTNENIIAFKNGVWELKEGRFRRSCPDDYLTMHVGYDYCADRDDEVYEEVKRYWKMLHPNEDQRVYMVKTFARQLQGDVGQNLFHIHAGYQGSAGNGKTTFFEVLQMCLGKYARKFGVEMLTAKQRIDPGKPMPDFQHWKGARILYCTEPNHDDVLNTGILKDLTGGEEIMYRMLYANDIQNFKPQFNISILCNDSPKVDGSDSGVKRRIRKIDYMSQFVTKDQVDESNHYYLRDDTFIGRMRNDPRVRMEFLRYLLDNYEHDYQFEMPAVVKSNSAMYLEENDNVFKFVSEFIVKDATAFFTLKEAKDAFKYSEYFNGKILTLKNDLQKVLKCVCIEGKKINKKCERNVFMGYKVVNQHEIYED